MPHFVVQQQRQRRQSAGAHGSARGHRCFAGASPPSTWSFYWGIRSARRWDSGSVSCVTIATNAIIRTKSFSEAQLCWSHFDSDTFIPVELLLLRLYYTVFMARAAALMTRNINKTNQRYIYDTDRGGLGCALIDVSAQQ